MATWDDMRAAALRLPETAEHVSGDGRRTWRVRDKSLAWERPLRKTDLAALGPAAPTGPLVAFRTTDLLQKDEILAAKPDVFFTIPHFDGYPAVLARLELLELPVLEQLLLDAWLDRAPKRLVRDSGLAGGGGTNIKEGVVGTAQRGATKAPAGPKRIRG